MELQRFGERLGRWTASHPEWAEGVSWAPDVACLLYEADDATVLVDPLLPAGRRERDDFIEELDRLVKGRGLPFATLLTVSWHSRSRNELQRRYGSWPHTRLPHGIESFEAPIANETLYWLPAEHALIVGDVLLGGPEKLRLPPPKWLEEGRSVEQVRRELVPLLELPIELILPSHGEPVSEKALAVLAAALEPQKET